MYLTMLCLRVNYAVAMPVSGSFQTYTTKFIGPGVGFAIGWLYWLGWAVTVALEFLSAGQLMQRWFPESPVMDVVCNICFSHLFTKRFISKGIW